MGRRRGSIGIPPLAGVQWDGSASTNRPCRFRAGVGRVACLCLADAAGKHRSPFSIAIRRSRRRRTGKETSEKLVKFDSRFGISTPQSRSRRRLHGAECAPVSRIVRVVCLDGRQRRGQYAFEPFQPTVKLTAYRSAGVRARYGLRGVRVGEATHPRRRVTPQREVRYCSVEPSATFASHTSRLRW